MSDPQAKPERSAQNHMARGSIWAIGARWSLRLLGLISTIILARLLTPADYGVVAIAMIIVGTVEVFSQTGQYSAIIRHPNPTREHYDSAWTVSLLLGLGLGVIILAATPLTTAYFHEPNASLVVMILAFRTMLLGTQNIGVVNFRRHLQFQKQFWFNFYPSVIAFVTTVAAAWVLRNYWALVIGIMSQHVATVVLSYTMEPFRPRLGFSKVREIWGFSVWTLFRSIGNYAHSELDKIAIGGFAGAAAMGRYDVSRDIAISPVHELIDPMVSMLLPVMARVQTDHAKRRELYLSVLSWSALICTSTSVGVALISVDMVDLLLGSKWHDVSPLIPWFALSAGLVSMSSSVYSAFDTIGRPVVSARLQWLRVLVLGAAVFPVAFYFRDLHAVVVTRFLVAVVITPTLFYALSKALDIPLRDFAFATWRPLLAGVPLAIVVLGVNAAIDFTGTPRLLLDIALGACTFVASVMLFWVLSGRPEGPERVAWEYFRPWLALLRQQWVSLFKAV